METTGLKKLNNGSYVCEKCDNNLFKTMLHLDYEDKAVTTYKCECGAVVTVTIERKWNNG